MIVVRKLFLQMRAKMDNTDDKLETLIKTVQYLVGKNIDLIEKNSKLLHHIHKNMVKFNDFHEINTKTVNKMGSLKKELKHIADTNKSVEETICNIWLAIKQNEYLQAWIPKPTKLGEK